MGVVFPKIQPKEPKVHQDSPSTQIAALRGSKDLILEFWAPWCEPCKRIMPEVDRFAALHPEVSVIKVNVDVERELVAQWEVRTIPVMVYVPAKGAPRSLMGFARAEEIARKFLG